MNVLKNIIWLTLGGIISVLFWGALGALFCATIVGIPLGKQLFQVARLALWPFRDDVEYDVNFTKHIIANIIWSPLGLLLISFYAVVGAVFWITLIGMPIGETYFKLLIMSASPFGIEVDKKAEPVKEWEEWKNW